MKRLWIYIADTTPNEPPNPIYGTASHPILTTYNNIATSATDNPHVVNTAQ